MLTYLLIGLVLGSLMVNYPILIMILPFIIYRVKRSSNQRALKYLLFGFLYCLSISFFKRLDTFSGASYFVVVDAKDNYLIVRNFLTKYYLSISNNHYEIGDVIFLKGQSEVLNLHHLEQHFDFASYLNQKGVFYALNVDEIELKWKKILRLRDVVLNISKNYDDLTGKMLLRLFYGRSSDVFDSYVHTSFSYLLILNSFLFRGLMSVFSQLIARIKNPKLKVIPIAIFSIYLALILPIKAVRRTLLFFVILRLIPLKNVGYLTKLKIILALYLLISPFNIFDVGLQFSLIICCSFYLMRHFKRKWQKSLGIIVIIMLLNILYNNQLPLTGFLVRLCLLAVLLFYYLILFLSMGNIWKIDFSNVSRLFLSFLDILKRLDVILYLPDTITFKVSFVFILGLTLGFYYFRFRRGYKTTSIAIVTIFLINVFPIQNYLYDYLYFLDVGQGDAALIVHNNQTIMIDTGGLRYDDLASTTLIPFFKSHQINDIDVVICSHSDYDHCGALSSLKENFKVHKVVEDKEEFPLVIGDLTIENLNNYESDNVNDSSLVNHFFFMGSEWLFLGDISQSIERKIVQDYDLSTVDYLKVAHHGSDTSTSLELLEECRPNEAIISLGFKNFYGFPSDKVISRLQKYDIKIRRTDLEGTIVYKKLSI